MNTFERISVMVLVKIHYCIFIMSMTFLGASALLLVVLFTSAYVWGTDNALVKAIDSFFMYVK